MSVLTNGVLSRSRESFASQEIQKNAQKFALECFISTKGGVVSWGFEEGGG